MKKRVIPIVLICFAAIFFLGLWMGTNLEIERLEDHRAMRDGLQTTIAVVNADVGVMVDGEMQNFASAIIDTLSDDFVLVSPAMAHMGYTDGTYGAIVIFPSNVSAQILTFNTTRPERVRLDFQINSYLHERDYVETHFRIMELQHAVNTMLSYTFVSSIFGQFHMAQDHIDRVFANDLATIDALNILYFPNFTTILQLDQLPDVPFDPNEVDTSAHLLAFTDFGRNISNMYRTSYDSATRDYIRMRDDLIRLTDGFFDQKEAWLEDLTEWTNISVEYGESLEEFDLSSQAHMDELEAWHIESLFWMEAMEEYEADMILWSEEIRYWFEEYSGWREEHYDYWDAVVAFSDALAEYRETLGNLELVEEEMTAWYDALVEFVTDIHDIFIEARDRYNAQLEIANPYWDELNIWHTGLEDYYDVFADWNDDIQSIITALHADFNNLDNMPDETLLTSDPTLYAEQMTLWREAMEEFVENLELFLNASAFEPSPSLPTLPTRPSFANDFAESWLPLEWDNDANLIPPTPGIPTLTLPTAPDEPPEDALPPRPDMSEPPIYPTLEPPEPLAEPPQAEMELPENPLVPPPPQPDDFWISLEFKHEQLLSFDIDDYLTDALIAQVDGMLAAYEAYLDTVRADLAMQFEMNVMLLFDAYFEYSMFLSDLRMDAFQAEADGVDHLHTLLAEYFDIATDNSGDTHGRMASFAGMMPESRTTTGVNHELVGFTVAPFEIGSPVVRSALEAVYANLEFLYWAMWIFGGLLVLTLLSYVVGHLRAKHSARKRAERMR